MIRSNYVSKVLVTFLNFILFFHIRSWIYFNGFHKKMEKGGLSRTLFTSFTSLCVEYVSKEAIGKLLKGCDGERREGDREVFKITLH